MSKISYIATNVAQWWKRLPLYWKIAGACLLAWATFGGVIIYLSAKHIIH